MTIPNNLALRLVEDADSYVSADTPNIQMIANRAWIGPREEFRVVSLPNSVYALKSSTGKFVQVHDDNKLYPDGEVSTDLRCQFQIMQAAGGGAQNVTLQSMQNKLYWSVRENASKWLECSVKTPQGWETFHYRGIEG
ncbi:MAG TPA: hypothetical protein VN844_28345 [Pyrinomonadaceae bacterium]|jgi:hypothetical protein|nr:hypothetical protein [Pyrinomonadaceae bacterium]